MAGVVPYGIVKRTVRFPFSHTIPGGGSTVFPIAAAIPATAEPYSTNVLVRSNANPYYLYDPDNATIPITGDLLSNRLNIPRNSGLRGIGIAPDSLIHTADLAIGGKHTEDGTFRISPGNPYIGSLDEYDFVDVTLPISLPSLAATNSTAATDGFAWDALPGNSGAGEIWQWPLRLELWYGDNPPIRQPFRAPMHATARVILAAAAASRRILFCVDGRRTASIDILPATSTLSYTVEQVVPAKALGGLNDTFNRRVITGPTSAGTVGVPFHVDVFPMTATPISILSILLSDSVGAATPSQLDFHAWDL
jgi:hypothetical protein